MTTTNNITELARDLTKSVREMRSIMRLHIQAKLREYQFDISFELLEILAYLWRQDGVNQQEIADIIIKDKSSTTYLIDNLVKRNLVVRIADENDRRNKLIFLTKEGKQLLRLSMAQDRASQIRRGARARRQSRRTAKDRR